MCAHTLKLCAHTYICAKYFENLIFRAENQMRKKNIRIKDIAKAAGVSVGTVDRVLHNRGKVSEDALKKVTSILKANEYKPNIIARMLGSNRSYKIAVMLPNPDQDPYWAITRMGIAEAESEWIHYGVQVITCP